ncbi:MAG: type III-B CRISPR-associated protein Cas10/Cmr2 [Leptolyngbyaceae bacterium]|nr:type III-B CRISPR-associated protein Cas10/Cmr2 [Leptolyngbyaceae bacterium]
MRNSILMEETIFTAITFSPVTEFIEKTRKLRDLYGSSFILSYLADSVCSKVQEHAKELKLELVSPVSLNIAMGTPDQIVIRGHFPEDMARDAFFSAWSNIMDACKVWIENSCEAWISEVSRGWVSNGEWNRTWQQWKTHAWEFFWVQADSIPNVLNALNEKEADRDWVGINWMGESSTLSGADAIAWPGLDRDIPAKQRSMSEADTEIRSFYRTLNRKIGEAILDDDLGDPRSDRKRRRAKLMERYGVDPKQREPFDISEIDLAQQADLSDDDYIQLKLVQKLGEPIVGEREQLSIPELTKRLSTLKAVAQDTRIRRELPESFRDVNLWTTDCPMGWFRGDGDNAGKYIRKITSDPATASGNLKGFSGQMRRWARELMQDFDQSHGRIVFAGGDDFLGVFYPSPLPTHAIQWLCDFKETVWHEGETDPQQRKPVTPSVGFVWASPQVPQRDVLQHCEQAERVAKDSGRDRLCLRVLFASGTHVDWTCPWWFLPKVVNGYRDRNGKQDWTHFYKDVAALQSRHAFRDNHHIALALFNLFFHDPDTGAVLLPKKEEELFDDGSPIWTQPGTSENLTGILNEDLKQASLEKQQKAFNDWVIDLAEVGFQLFNSNDR